MRTAGGTGRHVLLDLMCSTGVAEREQQFGFHSVGQNRVVQPIGWQDPTFYQSVVNGNVSIIWLVDEFRMTNGVLALDVGTRIEGDHILVMDLLFSLYLMVQFNSHCPTTKEGIPRVEGGHKFQIFEELLEAGIGFDVPLPLTLSFLDDVIPNLSQVVDPLLRGRPYLPHGLVLMVGVSLRPVRKAGFTAMMVTTLKLVRGVG